MADCYNRTSCRLCGREALETVVALAPTPPGNNFLPPESLNDPEPSYPIELRFCTACHHVQLGHVVDPKILFHADYRYVSGISPVFIKHFEDYAIHATERLGLADDGFVVDIGSNDGTCLKPFQRRGRRVLGIDPATEIARRANEDGVETIPDFFSSKLARALREKHGPADLVTSHNACAHIDDLADVIAGVKTWLRAGGHFVFEVGYFVDVLTHVWFDTIYHEHLDYHTVAPLVPFFRGFEMEVVAVERIKTQGGSIRVIVENTPGAAPLDDSIEACIALERSLGLNEARTLREFGRRIDGVKVELTHLLADLKAKGHSIAGYGAPTKSTTLLAHFGIDGDTVDFIVDDSPFKQGLFSPGLHIPVVSAEELYRRNPDYLIVLAWNFAEPIMKNHRRYEEQGGRFILPMPVARIVEPS